MSADWVTQSHVDRLSETMSNLLSEASEYRAAEGADRNENTEYFATLNERIRQNMVVEKLRERGVTGALDGGEEEVVAQDILAAVKANREKLNEMAGATDESVRSRLADAVLGAIAGVLVDELAGLVPDNLGPEVMDVVVDVVVALA